ncbi:MAG: carbohydrate ABC transporter permease [Clostridia bacterium]|nr:carbohydrate ABC transporter permease [Clostridia bacterium]
MDNKNTVLALRKARGVISIIVKAVIIGIVAYPFLWMVFTAFKPLKESTLSTALLPQVWTLEGFRECFKNLDVWHFMKNSIVVSTSVLFLQYLIIIPAAYGFARVKFPGRGILFGVVLLGFMIPQQVTFVPVYLIFSKAKMLQTYWPQIAPFIANAFGIFLLRQYFMQIPEEIIESARMDNASEPKIIVQIMIPMAKTALFTIGLLSFISSWNSYFWPLIMTTKNTYRPLAVGVAMLRSVDAGIEWNKLMAGNVFLAGPILIAYFFANKQIRKAFVYSGIK